MNESQDVHKKRSWGGGKQNGIWLQLAISNNRILWRGERIFSFRIFVPFLFSFPIKNAEEKCGGQQQQQRKEKKKRGIFFIVTHNNTKKGTHYCLLHFLLSFSNICKTKRRRRLHNNFARVFFSLSINYWNIFFSFLKTKTKILLFLLLLLSLLLLEPTRKWKSSPIQINKNLK